MCQKPHMVIAKRVSDVASPRNAALAGGRGGGSTIFPSRYNPVKRLSPMFWRL
jgi:hypothetical protein